MKDEHLFAIYLCIIMIGVGVALITIRLTDKINKLDQQIEYFEEKIEELQEMQYEQCKKEAPVIKKEPENVEIEIRPEYATPEDAIEETEEKNYVGMYELTAYVETGNPCADGVYPSVGYTVACNDPNLWHKLIEIEGYGKYYVHDTGGMANNVIDIFVASYDEAIQFGRRTANVYVIGE